MHFSHLRDYWHSLFARKGDYCLPVFARFLDFGKSNSSKALFSIDAFPAMSLCRRHLTVPISLNLIRYPIRNG